MVKFFLPEDFYIDKGCQFLSFVEMAAIANTKLEREGRVVYGLDQQWGESNVWGNAKKKAILINIEPIKVCEHPKEKVKEIIRGCQGGLMFPDSAKSQLLYESRTYECECGARLEPETFREVK